MTETPKPWTADPNAVAIVAALLRISEVVRMQGNLIRMSIEEEEWDIDDMTTEECLTEAHRMIAAARQGEGL